VTKGKARDNPITGYYVLLICIEPITAKKRRFGDTELQ